MILVAEPTQGPRCTPRNLVQLCHPDVTDEEADFILWELTCFPFGSINEWLQQVREVRR